MLILTPHLYAFSDAAAWKIRNLTGFITLELHQSCFQLRGCDSQREGTRLDHAVKRISFMFFKIAMWKEAFDTMYATAPCGLCASHIILMPFPLSLIFYSPLLAIYASMK